MKLLVSGCCGLIGAHVVERFCGAGHSVVGIDNFGRADFFGPAGDTSPMADRLTARHGPGFRFIHLDIRSSPAIRALFKTDSFDAVVHCAAQPSHDWAAADPLADFSINATGTLVMLEAARQHCPEAPFVHCSTNKVYGDGPNRIPRIELGTRLDFSDDAFDRGIPETFPIDQCTHSLFGASKLAADVMVQEYGRYFGMPTVCLRAGCLTGAGHAAVEQHGFLSYLAKCAVTGTPYTVYGYDGLQVRDNLHAEDVAAFIELFIANPRVAAVYNLGGGRANAVSIIEAVRLLGEFVGRPMSLCFEPTPRRGDHVVYYSDLTRLKADYPAWQVTWNIPAILANLVEDWSKRGDAR